MNVALVANMKAMSQPTPWRGHPGGPACRLPGIDFLGVCMHTSAPANLPAAKISYKTSKTDSSVAGLRDGSVTEA
jgi:hypothetical protein